MAAKKETERRSGERRTAPKAAPKTAKPTAFNPHAVTDTGGSSARANISPEELRQLISEAAYYRAKQRGFAPGHEVEDWIQAEAEVMRRLGPASRPA